MTGLEFSLVLELSGSQITLTHCGVVYAVKDRTQFLEKPNDPFCLAAGAELGVGKGLSLCQNILTYFFLVTMQ